MGDVLNAMMLQADMLKNGAMADDWYIACPDGWSVLLDQSFKRKFVQAFQGTEASLKWTLLSLDSQVTPQVS